MKLRKNKNHGFTIVELVIVIAIIGILSAILIPTFAGLIKKAKLTADERAIASMNVALKADEVTNGKPTTLEKVNEILTESGYRMPLSPASSGHEFYWIANDNLVVLVLMKGEEPEKIIFPEDMIKKYESELPQTGEWFKLGAEPSCVHSYGEWFAKEDDNTKHVRTCTLCGESEEELHIGDPCALCGYSSCTSHSWSYRCDADKHWEVCSNCGVTKEETGVVHSMTEWEVLIEPTCETKGLKEQHCSVCGIYQVVEEMPAEHSYVYYEKPGSFGSRHFEYCTICHTCSDEKGVVCTCDDDNKCKVADCFAPASGVSSEPNEHAIIKLNGSTDDDYHYYECIACGRGSQLKEIFEAHNTLGENGACSVCGYKSHDHRVENWTTTTPATCLDNGIESGICTVDGCGKTINRIIPATGHNFTSYNKRDIFNHGGECSVCGNATASHKFNTEKIIDGKKYYVCDCGAMLEIPEDTTVEDMTHGGFNADYSNWGAEVKVIDGKEYTLFEFILNSGSMNGKKGIYYVPVD